MRDGDYKKIKYIFIIIMIYIFFDFYYIYEFVENKKLCEFWRFRDR